MSNTRKCGSIYHSCMVADMNQEGKLSMKKYSSFSLALAIAFLVIAASWSAEAQISIIVSKSSPQKAGASELKQIFSGAKVSWPNGTKILVIDQPETDAGKKFYGKFVEKSFTQVRTQWMKLVLSGQATAPMKCADDAAVIKAVTENPGAVGYILSSALDASVREIGRVE
jgi:ABC-type phosphate transport system substrate-binding protein